MRSKLTNRWTLGWLLLTLGHTAAAEAQISFDQAIAKALESNPTLTSFGYQLEAQQGVISHASTKPNVELGIEVENAFGTGPFSGLDGAEATISLAWSLERGKRQHRVDAARAGLSFLESEAELQRLDVAAETGRLFLASLAHQSQLDLADEAIAMAGKTVAAVERRVQAGRTPRADLARAEVDLARVELERDHIEHRLITSIRSLAAQWGETRPAITSVQGNLAELPQPDGFKVLLTRIDQSPGLRRFLSERRLREAKLRSIESDAKPDWRLMTGVRQMQLTDEQAFVASITIPLGADRRNQGRVATARADLARSDADRAVTRIQLETRLFALYEELKHSLHIATTLHDEILPRVDRGLLETQRAYEQGRYSYVELRIAQNDALRARTDVTAALIDAHRNVLEIEALTGTALTSPAR